MKKSLGRALTSLGGIILLCMSAEAETLTVTSASDAGGSCPGADCTLRQAIATAAAGDTIAFSMSPGDSTITLTSGELLIDKNLVIRGPGANRLAVSRGSGASDFSIFHIASSDITSTISGLTISNGKSPAHGGGILNSGVLTVRDCTISGNSASPASGGGGGINNNFGGLLTLINCTISGNTALDGGGIFATGMATIINCTISGNTAGTYGGGLLNNSEKMIVTNCTIHGNTAENGGGIYASLFEPTTHVRNTIIEGNTGTSADPDVSGNFISEGYNLVATDAAGNGFSGPGDQVGTAAFTIGAALSPLQDNGGPTKTHTLLTGSKAIDKGKSGADPSGQPINTDQRGQPRLSDRAESNAAGGDGTDIGAVELGLPQTGPTFTVTTTVERNQGGCTTDDCSLFEALAVANAVADANTINFAPGVEGYITTTFTPSGLPINFPVTINGPGAKKLFLSGETTGRIFNNSAANVTISGLSFFYGKVTDQNGGGILNTGGLTVNDCAFAVDTAMGSGSGGAIYSASGSTLVLQRCSFLNNTVDQFGGAVFNDGIFSATNCTFAFNQALRGGGIISRANGGASNSTLRNCTLTQNIATSTSAGPGDGGGGYFGEGNTTQHHIGNSIIAGNTNSVNPDVRGNITSDGHNLIGNVANAAGFSNNVNGDQVGTPGAIKSAQLFSITNDGGPTLTCPLLSNSTAINAGDNNLAPPTDQRGYGRNGIADIGAYEFHGVLPVTLANISTRLLVETGDNVLIAGFIITGAPQKKVMIRAIGPSLPFPGRLDNPTLELRNSAGTLLASNDDWMNSSPTDKQAIIDSTIPPSNDLESAIVATLPAFGASYTALVRGANNGTGIGVVEAYDLDRTANSILANIATRGFVQTGDNVLIAGTIVLGSATQKVIVRAIGPSLPIAGKLENPTLELRDVNGTVLEANDNWVDSPNKQAIIDSTIPPGNDLESAIVRTLSPANYTAVVRGVNDTTGIAVVEVYALN